MSTDFTPVTCYLSHFHELWCSAPRNADCYVGWRLSHSLLLNHL